MPVDIPWVARANSSGLVAKVRPISRVMSSCWNRLRSDLLNVRIPGSVDIFMKSWSSSIRLSRISRAEAGEMVSISTARTRPLPSRRGNSRWERIPVRQSERSMAACWRRCSGK
ncbi:MAG: hypothetical protein HY815_07310 [Candidatus Riflebacteria bacterium]|nr:hypothetical protein [Candidatus Riflebacteria bacterium]